MTNNLYSGQANDRDGFCRKNKKLMNLTSKQSDDIYVNKMKTKKYIFLLLLGMLTPMLATAQDYIETERK